jgi:hypothetical protein
MEQIIRIYCIYGDTIIKMLLHLLTYLVIASQLFRNLFSLLDSIINISNHVECTFRKVYLLKPSFEGHTVMFAFNDGLEASNCILQGHELAFKSSEDFSDCEGLRHETLEFSGTFDGKFIGFGQLVHSKNGNDILKRLVILKHLLDSGGNLVVFTCN